jgi:RNA polymerase sigma factor (sigma-70 family)
VTELVHDEVIGVAKSAVALDWLAEAHYPWLQRMCVSLTGSGQEGQDLAQEVMSLACRHFASIQDPEAFRPWLREVARNKLIDWLRRRRREQAALAAVASSLAPESDLAANHSDLDLQAAIAALPFEQRAALILHYFLGLRYREIAKAMGCPIGTVMSRLSAARSKLRQMLAEPSDGGS